MGRKKMNCSDKSRNEEDGKKLKGDTENNGSLTDEVFADGLYSPNCPIISVNFLRSI